MTAKLFVDNREFARFIIRLHEAAGQDPRCTSDMPIDFVREHVSTDFEAHALSLAMHWANDMWFIAWFELNGHDMIDYLDHNPSNWAISSREEHQAKVAKRIEELLTKDLPEGRTVKYYVWELVDDQVESLDDVSVYEVGGVSRLSEAAKFLFRHESSADFLSEEGSIVTVIDRKNRIRAVSDQDHKPTADEMGYEE